jgi:hypothetical protein
LDTGSYPTTQQGLEALTIQPEGVRNWREGGYLDKGRLLKDPWGNEYIYLSPGTHGDFDIISYGADGQPGGEGVNADINSWEMELAGSFRPLSVQKPILQLSNYCKPSRIIPVKIILLHCARFALTFLTWYDSSTYLFRTG